MSISRERMLQQICSVLSRHQVRAHSDDDLLQGRWFATQEEAAKCFNDRCTEKMNVPTATGRGPGDLEFRRWCAACNSQRQYDCAEDP